MNLQEFLMEFGDILQEKIKGVFQSTYDPSSEGRAEKQLRKKLESTLRKPKPKQAEAILALIAGFRDGHRGLFLVGEMGVGKTQVGVDVAYLMLPERSRTLVLCPGHLVDKWMREIKIIVPNAIVVNLNNPGLKELVDLKKKKKPDGREFWVIGKERAKNHFSRKKGTTTRKGFTACPACGFFCPGLPDPKKKKIRCEKCNEPLWEADRTKFIRYAKSEFIKRFLRPGTFDLCLADEVHQFKAGNSAQGQAFANLICSAKKTLCLTGTLMGGYSTNLFYLLYRLVPRRMANICQYGHVMSFAEDYGIVEWVEKEPLEDNAASIGGNNRSSQRVIEKPGISPTIFTDLLLEISVFLKLDDLDQELPKFEEQVVEVSMTPVQLDAYKTFEADLRNEVTRALAAGDKSLLGALINSLLAYPDGARRGEIVRHPGRLDGITGEKEIVCTAPVIDEKILPKEDVLIDLVEKIKNRGRKTMICLEHTGKRDLIPDLVDRLEPRGIKTLVLRQGYPSAAKRESWLKKKMVEMEFDVMICNPRLVETGLDLLEFPSIIYFQTGYSVFTLRQSSRRSWRIGQTEDVEIFYLCYEESMQAIALSLMADKMQVALAIEGDLSDKGLTAIAEGETSMLIQMAKALTNGHYGSASKSWEGYKKAVSHSQRQLSLPHQVEVQNNLDSVQKIQRAIIQINQGVGVAQLAEDVSFRFQKGVVYFKQHSVGSYDQKGRGQINGKLIQISRSGDNFLLYELRQDNAA